MSDGLADDGAGRRRCSFVRRDAAVTALVRDEQRFDFPAQLRISFAGAIKKRSAPGRLKFQRRLIERFDFSAGFGGYCHGWRLLNPPRPFLHHAAMPPQLSTSIQGFLFGMTPGQYASSNPP